MRTFIESKSSYRHGFMCQLGAPKDSSSIVTYWASDVAPIADLRPARLEEALGGESIVFADDFIGSGRQAVSILEALLDVAPTVELGEERGKPLAEDLRNLFRKKKLAFVFSAGLTEGREFLMKRCAELELDATVHVLIGEGSLARAWADQELKEDKAATQLRDRCVTIGRQLLQGDPKAEERVLGYGNRALLILFPYNVPTQTLTCVWQAGVVDGRPWEPLFRRRRKR